VTRFALAFLTLTSILKKNDQLRKKVIDSMSDTLRDVKSKKGKDVTPIIMNPTFWKDVKMCLSVFEPLVKLLHLIDGDVKPSMGFLWRINQGKERGKTILWQHGGSLQRCHGYC
jgi:hypothetical protein